MNSTVASVCRATLASKYLGMSLAAWHLCIVWSVTGAQDKVILNGLLWWAISSKVHPFYFGEKIKESGVSYYVGVFLILSLLPVSLLLMFYSISHTWLRLLPWIFFLSWLLISHGIAYRHYWRCFGLIFLITLPEGFLSNKIEPFLGIWLQRFLAQASHFLLHYLGISAIREDVHIILPQGSVAVEYGCAGVPLLILLIQLFALLTSGKKMSLPSLLKLITVILSIFVAVTSTRIALMAVLVDQPEKFDYLHSSQGAGWFSTLAIVAVTLTSLNATDRSQYSIRSNLE